jgi:two-component system response regulator YesN
MYKIAIVEDERDVRSRIVSLINKAQSGFEIVSEYETGIDAYDGIISDSPDLILTDIKIPFINGIELIKKVREVLPLVKVAIITGYNEFDYAKEAANLGVVGFVSKPITLDDMTSLLKKAEDSLNNEYLNSANLSKLTAFYESSLPIIRENDLYHLSDMSDVSPSFENKLRGVSISLDYTYFIMCMFDFDESRDESERYELAFSSIRKSVGEDFAGVYKYEMFNRYEKLCVLVKSNSPIEIKELEYRLERIIQRAGRYSDMPVSAGISSLYKNSRNFAQMTKETMRALEQRSIMGGNRVFFYGNAVLPASNLSADDSLIKELGYMLHFSTKADCLERVDRIWDSTENYGDSIYYIATGIANALIKACDHLSGLYTRFGGPDNIYRRLFAIKKNEEIRAFLKELVGIIRDLNDEILVDSMENNLRRVMLYVQNHYCDQDISFDSLTRNVNLSVSYISILLKKKLNTTLIKLLTDLRIDRAKQLLTNPALKIIDVAEQVGYNDSSYFSHCFKKREGMSPKEFRQYGINT